MLSLLLFVPAMAIAAGLQKSVEEGTYHKLLVSRPIFPLGRDIGYLPGEVILDASLAKAGINVDPEIVARGAKQLKARGDWLSTTRSARSPIVLYFLVIAHDHFYAADPLVVRPFHHEGEVVQFHSLPFLGDAPGEFQYEAAKGAAVPFVFFE